jgi:4'-phosphopantetheinyl transferase
VSLVLAVWSRPLDRPATDRDWEVLSVSEQDRAARIGHPRARSRFVLVRAMLRELLAEPVGVGPSTVRIEATLRGRPWLADDPAVHLGISHTDDVGVVAIASGPVGVDVERADRRPVPDPAMWLTAAEQRHLAPGVIERHRQLLGLWTAKEAVLKAIDPGIATGLRSVGLGGDGRIAVLERSGTVVTVLPLDVSPRHVAALAVRGPLSSAPSVGRFGDQRGDRASARSSTWRAMSCTLRL